MVWVVSGARLGFVISSQDDGSKWWEFMRLFFGQSGTRF